jgi:hypothetical protein
VSFPIQKLLHFILLPFISSLEQNVRDFCHQQRKVLLVPLSPICTFMDDLVFEKSFLHPHLSQRERDAAARLYTAPENTLVTVPKLPFRHAVLAHGGSETPRHRAK